MIPFPDRPAIPVSEQDMQTAYELVKTPYKYGAVLKFEDRLCDCPSVFRLGDRWYMVFIEIAKAYQDSGYDSHIAESDDLLHWRYLRPILTPTHDDRWDSQQIAAYAAFVDIEYAGEYRIRPLNGRYAFSYLGGALKGYETDPLMDGMVFTDDITDPARYERLDAPVLRPDDADARPGERLTIYKPQMFEDQRRTLGYRYVNAYNAKDTDHRESIFLAVSEDGVHWERYGEHPILRDETPDHSMVINGDPQILCRNGLYIMVYFNLQYGHAYNTFACSYDLIHWRKWEGQKLVEPLEQWEDRHAHKTSIVVQDGVVYHYYCACNDMGERFIALAVSQPLQNV